MRTFAGAKAALLSLVLLTLPPGSVNRPRAQEAGVARIGPELPLPAKPRGHYHFNELGRAPHPPVPGPLRVPDAWIEPLKWDAVDGWPRENHLAAFEVFRTSCRTLIASARNGRDSRSMLHALIPPCRRAQDVEAPTEDGARKFFEENFVPARIARLGDDAGFLTGYYEPIVEGSRFPTQVFKVPVYRRPPDLEPPAGTRKGEGFPNTGQSLRRTADGKLVPYYPRGEIENGALDGQHLEICWLKDPVDLFYMQIQGSARVRLEDGTLLRLNYAAHNGHPYTPIGRVLIERKEVSAAEMSMQRIRQWMAAAPDGGRELRSHNKAFVFFRVSGLGTEDEPAGAQGIPLTAGRSIAVDKALHVYGTPFFITADLPLDSSKPDDKFHRIMIAQDTGSAITGPARADLYFGAGDAAGKVAGRIRNPGTFTMLIPREIDPVAAGAAFPLPPPRPDVEEIIAARNRARARDANAAPPAAKPAGNAEAAKPAAKGKASEKPAAAAAPAPAARTTAPAPGEAKPRPQTAPAAPPKAAAPSRPSAPAVRPPARPKAESLDGRSPARHLGDRRGKAEPPA